MSATKHQAYIVYPSELHEFAYCPRLYFFHRYMPRRKGLRERLRLFLGGLYHLIRGYIDRIRGYSVEEIIEARLGTIILRGRPDSYLIEGDTVRIVERKSGRAPRRGAWVSDVLQGATYAFILAFLREAREAEIRIDYRDSSWSYRLDVGISSMMLKAIEDLIEVKYHGIVPAAKRGPRKCLKCPYSSQCRLLDETLEVPEEGLYEPGSWLAGLNLIPPNNREGSGCDNSGCRGDAGRNARERLNRREG